MIRLLNVQKVYRQGKSEIAALAGVTLHVPEREFVVIMGPSGSGKSTLLHLMGGLDRPCDGEVIVEGRIISQMPDDPVTLYRRRRIGFVFQFFNLLPALTALENVMLPLILDGQGRSKASARATSLLKRVGLDSRSSHLPEELSGGESQRLAIARAIVFAPPILLADEPTGNLDSKTGDAILDLIRRINREENCTVVMVTHNPQAAAYGNRVIFLKDGLIDEDRSI
jgi:putative ABC transport system ATP-binding protein